MSQVRRQACYLHYLCKPSQRVMRRVPPSRRSHFTREEVEPRGERMAGWPQSCVRSPHSTSVLVLHRRVHAGHDGKVRCRGAGPQGAREQPVFLDPPMHLNLAQELILGEATQWRPPRGGRRNVRLIAAQPLAEETQERTRGARWPRARAASPTCAPAPPFL